ncbi:hypothetical protein [Comamonas odontotermitis]|uniref:hypothetical protein n=1 Tax=Comamonas odontotermitis TaxID=379895 RepID=UPI001CC4AE33|nr:hypothetical protein [Comamonas odontotermitis]UBB15425.1 hypothetical protein LAD35_11120 [Comamonas odontotermitis]
MNDSSPKDIKRSIRNKYKRRLRWLAHAVEQYGFAATERIENGGNIRDREDIEAILKAIEPLKKFLPKQDERDEKANRSISEALGIEFTPLDKDA